MKADHIPPACLRTNRDDNDLPATLPGESRSTPVRLALNKREAAEALGVSTPTLDQLGVPFIQFGTRKLFVIDAMRLWLLDQQKKGDGAAVLQS